MSNTKQCLNIAILTISDTRLLETDKSGTYLEQSIVDAHHRLADRRWVKDDIFQMRYVVSRWIADKNINAIITTGGTGFSDRDITPEALGPLFDKIIEGFGALFRQISYQHIGASTVQSRCIGGVANSTLIFCLPGSTNACKAAWEEILACQLDSTHSPCNFVKHTAKVKND